MPTISLVLVANFGVRVGSRVGVEVRGMCVSVEVGNMRVGISVGGMGVMGVMLGSWALKVGGPVGVVDGVGLHATRKDSDKKPINRIHCFRLLGFMISSFSYFAPHAVNCVKP